MGEEINLLKNYPKTKRDTSQRSQNKTEEDRSIARKFGREFFDGDRKHGYGGFSYNPRFWEPVIPDFINYYQLNANSKILDIGCAKGFMLYDFVKMLKGAEFNGVDVSEYAIQNCLEEVKDFVSVGNVKDLPFPDNTFDLVICINTIHNLELPELKVGLDEISRVSRKNSFITVDAYTNEEEKKRMFDWNLTAKTILSTNEWKELFKNCNYEGDYFWFIP